MDFSGGSVGEGHGNPLQYSYLENPMDRGAWWATVHGVPKNWSDWSDLAWSDLAWLKWLHDWSDLAWSDLAWLKWLHDWSDLAWTDLAWNDFMTEVTSWLKWLSVHALVAQWSRICLSVHESQVQSLVWEDPACHGATKPVSHNYWICDLEPGGCNHWAHVLQLLKPAFPRAHARQQEKPPQ